MFWIHQTSAAVWRKRASEASPESDGQQKDRFACPLPSHCRRRFLATKPHLFLTDYRKIIVITGSVPPSPREKALVQEESNIKNSLLPGAPTQLYKSIYPLSMWVVGACTPANRATPFSSPKSDWQDSTPLRSHEKMLDQQSAFRRRFTGFCCLLTLREHAETLSPKNKSLFGIIGKNGLNSGFLQ